MNLYKEKKGQWNLYFHIFYVVWDADDIHCVRKTEWKNNQVLIGPRMLESLIAQKAFNL